MAIFKTLRKAIANPRKAISVSQYRLLSVVGTNNYRRFIVLSRSRTGSNLLISLLNSHPHINVEGEIFGKLNGKSYQDILAKTFSRQPFYIKAKGFKIFYYHPEDDLSCGIWENLQHMDDLLVVHLKRRNILQTLVSRKIAGIQGVWARTSDEPRSAYKTEPTIDFSVDELQEAFEQTQRWMDDGDHSFRNHDIMSIYYEDLVNNRSATFREVTDFLGVEYIQPKTPFKKQNRRNFREVISNYDELKSAFSETDWAPLFED